MYVYLDGKRINLNPSMSIGKGGEADVFEYKGRAVKIFKPPDHPDFQGLPEDQRAARERLTEHQKKLPAFPRYLPQRVIVPEALVYDQNGKKVVGYVMQYLPHTELLLRYADRAFRKAGIKTDEIIKIFLDLQTTVSAVHQAKVVIGDFTDLNILVKNAEAHLIDADSFQFSQFLCRLFSVRFVDPLLCDSRMKALMPNKPHNENSDWYAFAIMLMQCLLFVNPYGGIYRPKNKAKQFIVQEARPLKRITIFHPEVIYPKPAVPYKVLPDDLLQYFSAVFEKDRRGEFPRRLIETIRWTKCTVCGEEHARPVCPFCAKPAPAAIRQAISIRGRVTATRLFRTAGVILYATHQADTLRWLYHENSQYKRESGSVVARGQLEPSMRFGIRDTATLMAKRGILLTFEPGEAEPKRLAVDSYGTLPMFDANELRRYWVFNGQLYADGKFGPDYPEYIGDVLTSQTLFWVGPTFGFGLYRAGNIGVAFVFNALHRGLNDAVKIPPIRGQLLDAHCVFSNDLCWFFYTNQVGSKIMNQCVVIRSNGQVEATASAEKGDCSWLGSIRSHVADAHFLLSATDEGLVRIELDRGNIYEAEKFPDTEPFVSAGNQLFVGKDGVYVVNAHDITAIKMT